MSKLLKNRKRRSTGHRGFSLIEMMMAVFIFSLVMTATMAAFVSIVKVKSRAKAAQQNMEDAKYALELMAKTLRTSTIISSTATTIQAYNYSQDLCVRYSYDGAADKLNWRTESPATPGDKSSCTWPGLVADSLTGNYIKDAKFIVIPSSAAPTKKSGMVTISLKMCSTQSCTETNIDQFSAQTTVSLRDYKEVN